MWNEPDLDQEGAAERLDAILLSHEEYSGFWEAEDRVTRQDAAEGQR